MRFLLLQWRDLPAGRRRSQCCLGSIGATIHSRHRTWDMYWARKLGVIVHHGLEGVLHNTSACILENAVRPSNNIGIASFSGTARVVANTSALALRQEVGLTFQDVALAWACQRTNALQEDLEQVRASIDEELPGLVPW